MSKTIFEQTVFEQSKTLSTMGQKVESKKLILAGIFLWLGADIHSTLYELLTNVILMGVPYPKMITTFNARFLYLRHCYLENDRKIFVRIF
jgi:hypothetical protein